MKKTNKRPTVDDLIAAWSELGGAAHSYANTSDGDDGDDAQQLRVIARAFAKIADAMESE